MIHRINTLNSQIGVKQYFIIGLIFLLAAVLPNIATAQSYLDKDSVYHNPRVYITAGVHDLNLQTELRLDSDIGLGTSISLEDDLKLLNEGFVFQAGGIVRAKRRSQFVFSYTGILRERNVEIDENIDFADTTFYVGAQAKFYFNTYYYSLTWRYSLLEKTNWNAGFSVGLRMVQFKTGLDASFNGSEYGSESTIGAPALLLGLHGSAYLMPRLLGRYSFEYLQLSVSDISIKILETRASLEYFVLKNVGLGVAYSTNKYLVENIPFNNDFEGRVSFEFGGFSLMASARF